MKTIYSGILFSTLSLLSINAIHSEGAHSYNQSNSYQLLTSKETEEEQFTSGKEWLKGLHTDSNSC